MRGSLAALVALLAAGCATDVLVKSNGFTVNERLLEHASSELTPRAAGDLRCEEMRLRWSVVGVYTDDPHRPEQLRARGCDHEATYVRMNRSTWVMTNNTTPAP